MTDDRSLERAARSWIEVGPTRAPDGAVEAALARIQTTPQERDWLPWRFPQMFTPARVAVAAVLGVLLLGGAYLTIDRLGQPAVGVPGPSPSPSPTVSPSPTPEAIVPVRMPDLLLGDWQAEAAEPIDGVSDAGERIQLALDWDQGQSAWIQPEIGELSLNSTSVAAAADELRFVSTGRLGGCTPGDEGRYRWERSADGLFLTLTVIEDACASRAAAFDRTWVHSLSAVTDGGPGVIPFDPWIQATLPSRLWGMSGPADGPVLAAFGEGAPALEFTAIRNPMGFDAPCSGTRQGVQLDPTAAAITEYVRGLPGVTVTTADASIGGLPAVHLTIESDAGVDCPIGEIMAFHPPRVTDQGEYTMALGQPRSFWVVERDGDVWVFWYAGGVGVTVTTADEQAVIDSIRFVDQLPTP
jgi:hypothetical protein